MPKKSKPCQLLVKGKNDRHVIWALCNQYQLPETFSVEIAEEDGTEGVDILLSGLPARVDEPDLQTLEIVVDADQDLLARWQAVRDRLSASGYQDMPKTPPAEGWVDAQPELPRIGVWLMPNNQLPGMLEDFVAHLIPENDELRPKAELILQEIEQTGLNRYRLVQRPKALIHTWLAWQQVPGMPMGQAITAQVLRYNSAIAQTSVAWLQLLFESLS